MKIINDTFTYFQIETKLGNNKKIIDLNPKDSCYIPDNIIEIKIKHG